MIMIPFKSPTHFDYKVLCSLCSFFYSEKYDLFFVLSSLPYEKYLFVHI